MLASIVISNYNYDRYLAQAVDSALNQTWPDVEVIVVDDASSDSSRSIIESYGDRIQSIFKQNGGQSSCLNAAFPLCRGDFLMFLDSDDYLPTNAVELHAQRLADSSVASCCGYLAVVDKNGNDLHQRVPLQLPESGDYAEVTLEQGLDAYSTPFTTGYAWPRWFLEEMLPLPEDEHVGTDTLLFSVDRFFGRLEFVHEPVGFYRRHGDNKGPMSFEFSEHYLEKRARGKQVRIERAIEWAKKRGYQVDEKKLSQIREWRNYLMRHCLSVMKREPSPVSFVELVTSPYQRVSKSRWRPTMLAIALVPVKLLPRQLALSYSEYLLNRARRVRFK